MFYNRRNHLVIDTDTMYIETPVTKPLKRSGAVIRDVIIGTILVYISVLVLLFI